MQLDTTIRKGVPNFEAWVVSRFVSQPFLPVKHCRTDSEHDHVNCSVALKGLCYCRRHFLSFATCRVRGNIDQISYGRRTDLKRPAYHFLKKEESKLTKNQSTINRKLKPKMDCLLASIFDEFWRVLGSKLGCKMKPRAKQKSIEKRIEKIMEKRCVLTPPRGGEQ